MDYLAEQFESKLSEFMLEVYTEKSA